MELNWEKYTLKFKRPGGTSRGVLHSKDTFFIHLSQEGKTLTGECNLFRGLSSDDVPDYEEKLDWLCANPNLTEGDLRRALQKYPSILFGWEQLQRKRQHSDADILYPSAFTQGLDSIRINGLIWMGDIAFMKSQIQEKLQHGFGCLKLKIGALNWAEEHQLLQEIRTHFPSKQLELRVDANGAFTPSQAEKVLDQLAELDVHSIEQPIRAGAWQEMAKLCATTPTPIALDEELIGVTQVESKENLIETIRPQYIILKPALVGGFRASEEWIHLAKKYNANWWATSALESNVGLNAIAQWAYTHKNPMPQGLGTGGLFTNNTANPLRLQGEKLYFSGR